jgi:hypothetical protein
MAIKTIKYFLRLTQLIIAQKVVLLYFIVSDGENT